METTHDEQYIKFIQKAFGTTSVPFFGALMVTVSLVLICIIVLFNSSLVFSHEVVIGYAPNDSGEGLRIDITKPVIV